MLADNAIRRTARKQYRCTTADEIVGWEAHLTHPSGSSTRYFPADQQAEAQEYVDQRIGTPATAAGTLYESGEVLPRRNRNHVNKAPDCTGTIEPGDPYIEYVGEAMPYQSGTRYCLPCGLLTWDQ